MTIETFVTMLWEQQLREEGKEPSSLDGCSLLDYGHHKGWLEDQDVRGADSQLNRQATARILHMFLRLERKETDEKDWHGADKIKDLYDCHTCVGHVAQIYAKGILECKEEKIFGMQEPLTEGEAITVIGRVFYPKLRRSMEMTKVEADEAMQQLCRAQRVSAAEAVGQLKGSERALLVDVRPREAYEKEHLTGAVCIPMAEILNHPEAVTSERNAVIYLYCEKGYQSEIAANCLADRGYENVRWFGTET